MSKEEREEYERQLNQSFDTIKRENSLDNNTLDGLIATPDRLGVDVTQKSSMDVIEENMYAESLVTVTNMARLYLSDENLLSNEYIKDKIKNNAADLSDMKFLQYISKMVIKKQVEQIELGEASPRFFETLSLHMKETRDSIKQSTLTINTMEKFYLELRQSLGIEGDINAKTPSENDNIEEGQITESKSTGVNTQDLQSHLKEIIKRNAEIASNNKKKQ
jgi:hypothetical protein